MIKEVASVPCDVSYVTAMLALGHTGFKFPTLHVSKELLGAAMLINQAAGHVFNIEVIVGATDIDTWWVEFDGRCVGSIGA